jgi:hypothetical protein
MQNPRALRRLAKRCRNFVTGSTAPPVATQLRLWAVELADAADDGERAAIRDVPKRRSKSRVARRAKTVRSRIGGYRPR